MQYRYVAVYPDIMGYYIIDISDCNIASRWSLYKNVIDVQDGLHESVWIYFVVLIIFGSFFAVNLALAVLYFQFTHSQKELEAQREDAALAAEAAEASRKKAKAVAGCPSRVVRPRLSVQPQLISSFQQRMQASKLMSGCLWIQQVCQKAAQEPKFEAFTLCLICLDTVLMASEYHGMHPWHTKVRWLPVTALFMPISISYTLCFASQTGALNSL
jgi:hypothetical protein